MLKSDWLLAEVLFPIEPLFAVYIARSLPLRQYTTSTTVWLSVSNKWLIAATLSRFLVVTGSCKGNNYTIYFKSFEHKSFKVEKFCGSVGKCISSSKLADAVIESTEIEVNDSSHQFEVGEKFPSLEAYESKLERHKNVVFAAEFWKRDSKTISGARKRGVEKSIKPDKVLWG